MTTRGVADPEHVRRHFSDEVERWLATAYGTTEDSRQFPVGTHRVRLALAALAERLGSRRGRLVDLGCGGGELCFAAVRAGFDAVGVDVAEGMITTANARRDTLDGETRARVSFRRSDALESGLPSAGALAVTALGLVEYLDDDAPFLSEAARLLRPGGVLVVSCRNRLFNLASLNGYTREEIEAGGASALLAELMPLVSGRDVAGELREFLSRLRAALPALEEALARDASAASSPEVRPFGAPRRQHTPAALATAARAAGFAAPRFIGVHPHPLPPALEACAPRFYNTLAAAWTAFEAAPASLAWSSAFLAIFDRC